MKSKNLGYFLIALAGICWATIGLFTNHLGSAGFSSYQIAFTKLFLGCLFLTVYSLITNPKALKITKKGLLIAILLGFFNQAIFNIAYVNTIKYAGVSVAAVLLYTSPIFLAIFSKVFLKEVIDRTKIISLVLCVAGACFAATGGQLNLNTISGEGILFGLISAIPYAALPLISRPALEENENITVIIYAFLFGTLFVTPLAKPWELIGFFNQPLVIINAIGLGLFPACLAFLFFYSGIKKEIQFSLVGIMSSTELIFAQIIGWILLGESCTLAKLLGIVFMVISTCVVLFDQTATK